MEWHDFVTMRGSEAAAVASILLLLGVLWRWVNRMRAATRERFARSIGEQVAVAMAPVVSDLDRKVNELRREWDERREVDDKRWAKTEEMYDRVHEHMDAEDKRG